MFLVIKDKRHKKALYPGTFDPVTNGHISLIERASKMFDELIVAVAQNAGKNPFFEFEDRLKLMTDSIKKSKLDSKVRVIGFDGLLANLAEELEVDAIVRGLRAVSDFEYEFQMALMNRKLAREIETVFLMPSLSWVYLSSTMVKDVACNGGDVTELVPVSVKRAFKKRLPTDNK
ncbi:MAG: pantetheine-phosphate adenylyltransferase [candidate division Zixibacteria bacterium]|nr:pantetheine-phosphate adenylyltransferase [candidate division Zixibacteria bacterium]